MRLTPALCALALTAALPAAANAQNGEDPIMAALLADPACDQETAEMLAAAARGGLERSVQRAEASIQPPAPVGDLACLTDLMDVSLDFAISMPDIQGLLIGAVDQAVDAACGFAMDHWNEATRPLRNGFNASIPALETPWGDYNLGGSASAGLNPSDSPGVSVSVPQPPAPSEGAVFTPPILPQSTAPSGGNTGGGNSPAEGQGGGSQTIMNNLFGIN